MLMLYQAEIKSLGPDVVADLCLCATVIGSLDPDGSI
jgi:hypothetical protein